MPLDPQPCDRCGHAAGEHASFLLCEYGPVRAFHAATLLCADCGRDFARFLSDGGHSRVAIDRGVPLKPRLTARGQALAERLGL